MNNIVYHALFVENKSKLKAMFPAVHPNIFYHHSTIEFKPKNSSRIELGRIVNLPIIGRITTDKVDALLVENDKSTNKFPHITLSTAQGVSPIKSNEAFEQYPEKIEMFKTPLFVDTVEGFFDGVKDNVGDDFRA